MMLGWFVCHCSCGQGYWCFNRSALAWLDGDDELPLDEIEADAKIEAARLGEMHGPGLYVTKRRVVRAVKTLEQMVSGRRAA